MSHYIAGGLMLLLLCGATLLGLGAYDIFNAARMVDAALLDAQSKLAQDGGLSPAVKRQITQRIKADGGDPDRLRLSGSPAHTAQGEIVSLHLTYEHPYALGNLLSGPTKGLFRIARTATTLSGWQP